MWFVVLLNEDPVVRITNMVNQVGGLRPKFCDCSNGVYAFSVVHLVGGKGLMKGRSESPEYGEMYPAEQGVNVRLFCPERFHLSTC